MGVKMKCKNKNPLGIVSRKKVSPRLKRTIKYITTK